MPVFPANIVIQHQMWQVNVDVSGNPILDADGNATGQLSAPVTRKIIAYEQDLGSPDPISPDFVQRTVNEIILYIHEGSIYNKLDRVLLYLGDQWVAWEVQGRNTEWHTGLPWQKYGALVGDTIAVKRVT